MVSDAFFVLTKVVGVLARLETLLVLLCLVALIAIRRGRPRLAGGAMLANAGIVVAVSVWPVGNLLLAPLERAYPPAPELGEVEGILVLGGGEEYDTVQSGGLPQVNHAGDRFLAAMELARSYPEATVLFSGGTGTVAPAGAGAENLGRAILLGLGLPEARLLVEGRSRNTTENARFSRRMAPETLSGQWVLVTSGFHMPRSVGTFCEAGWTRLVPWPTDFRIMHMRRPEFDDNLTHLNAAMREWVGLLGYRAAGRLADPVAEGCLDAAPAGAGQE